MRFAFLCCFIAGAAACDATPRDQMAAAPAPPGREAAPRDSLLIPGTPDGDLADWVRDIREGIATVPDLAATDRAAAQNRALDLYITRQEYAELYYGVEGRQRRNDELALAIETAEERFHDLMKLLSTERPSGPDVRSAVAELDQQQALVARLWQQSGRELRRSSAQ